MHADHRFSPVPKSVIVLGVGASLRSDVGIGRYVVEQLSLLPRVTKVADIAYTSVDIQWFHLHTYAQVIMVAAAHNIPKPVIYCGTIDEFARRASPLIRAFTHGRNDAHLSVSGWLIPARCTDIGMTFSHECRLFAHDVINALQKHLTKTTNPTHPWVQRTDIGS